MHTQNQEKKKITQEEQLFFYRDFLRRGSLVLQLLQAAQSFSTSPDKATQLDASLQGGARAQLC